jgi:hypothetical protein
MTTTLRIAALIALCGSTAASAGVNHRGTGATAALACYEANKAANARAHRENTCYRPCNESACTLNNGVYTGLANSSNHQGSCGRSGKVWPVSPANFPPPPGSAGPAIEEPSAGNNQLLWQPGVPSPNHATVTITNTGGSPATTAFEIWVRDTGYSFPQRAIAQEIVTIQPGSTFRKEYHQWRAADWEIRR